MGVPKPPSPSSAPESSEEEDERPTVVPPYDVEARAREAGFAEYTFDSEGALETPTVVPPGGDEVFRTQMKTLTDDAELEDARVRSSRSSTPMPGPIALERTGSGRWSIPPPAARKPPPEDPVIEILSTGDDDDEDTDETDPLDAVRPLLARGELSKALAATEEILRLDPSNVAARRLAEECSQGLVAQYTARLGSLERVPRIAMPTDRLATLSLDHRVGFLLALVDGASPIETIIDMSGMSPPDVLRTFVELHERGIIALR